MRLERFLPAAVFALMALWAVGFTVAVLRDSQMSCDMAVGAVIAAVLLPVFFAACVLGLLFWPLVRSDHGRDPEAPLPSER
jgi:hypothetical protein